MIAKTIAVALYVVAACMTTGGLNAMIVYHQECYADKSTYSYCDDARLLELTHLVQGAVWPLYWAINLSTLALGGRP